MQPTLAEWSRVNNSPAFDNQQVRNGGGDKSRLLCLVSSNGMPPNFASIKDTTGKFAIEKPGSCLDSVVFFTNTVTLLNQV